MSEYFVIINSSFSTRKCNEKSYKINKWNKVDILFHGYFITRKKSNFPLVLNYNHQNIVWYSVQHMHCIYYFMYIVDIQN